MKKQKIYKMDNIKLAIRTENLNAFFKEIKNLLSEDTYVQKDEFEDALIPCRAFGATPSGMIVVEVKGRAEEIKKAIVIHHKYQ